MRLEEKDLSLSITDKTIQWITDKGYDPIYGARPLKRTIQQEIEKFAKYNQCDAIEVAGRKGWLRKLKGYKQKIYLMSKEL